MKPLDPQNKLKEEILDLKKRLRELEEKNNTKNSNDTEKQSDFWDK